MKIRISILVIFIGNFFAQCSSQQKKLPSKLPGDSGYTWQKASGDGIGKFYLGREISRVMGAAASDWLERDEREKEENTRLAVSNITLPANATIADIGAGTGYYSFRLTAKVPQGKVYAVEIQDEMIRYLENKKTSLKDSIVEVMKGSEHSSNLPANSIDLAIMVDVYHELEFPREMLQDIRRSLRDSGQLLLIEYRGEDASVPIKPLHKTTVAQLNRELMANGFQLSYKGDFLPIQHFLLYKKVNAK